MSNIVQLDPNYDLWLTYSWSNNNHGVCGHLYEVIDYYHILKNHFYVGILLCEDIDWPLLELSIRSKYNFTEDEINNIKSNTIFCNRPNLLKGKNILFTDGGVVNTSSYTLLFDNIMYFACGNKEIKDNDKSNVYILQDDRVYEPVKRNGINYKKRILFSRLKDIGVSKKQTLLYATKNCRHIEDFQQYMKYDNILSIVSKMPDPVEGVEFVVAPVDNIFEQFTTYVYTPVERKWDCSPRFLAECRWYGKDIVFHNIDYWDTDHGLYWRWHDIRKDFDSLSLDRDDEIISILKEIIC